MPVEPGVCFPINHDGTQPRSPVSSLIAYDVEEQPFVSKLTKRTRIGMAHV